ncbi:MAG: OsmC family protein [Saprospiraceae bacterium]|jgi:organic hydroperoxide reductase OsmC/OhrA|nr:OsmC family protein [Saprospiraceae bacterium]
MRLKATSYQFEVNAVWQNDMVGLATAPGIRQVIVVSPPAAMLGDMAETAWSPEHLLLAAEAGCFLNTFQALADNEGFHIRGLECPATGKVELVEGRFAFTSIQIAPVITLLNDADESKAHQIADKAKHYCLITNSLKCPVTMNLSFRSVGVYAENTD